MRFSRNWWVRGRRALWSRRGAEAHEVMLTKSMLGICHEHGKAGGERGRRRRLSVLYLFDTIIVSARHLHTPLLI